MKSLKHSDERMLSPDQKAAVRAVWEEDGPFFLTGEAGSGKSFVVNHLRNTYPRCVVTAMTGAAAQLINGRTLHSFASLHPTYGVVRSKKANRRVAECNLLIIDEISMASLDVISQLHDRFEYARHYPKVLFVGDFLQLPPVDGEKLFESVDWDACQRLLLTTQHRQADEDFVGPLNDIRTGKLSDRAKRLIESRTVPVLPDDCVHLMSRRYMVERRNDEKLAELPGPVWESKMDVITPPTKGKKRAKCPSMDVLKRARFNHFLRLKEGARVVLLTNDRSGRWVNGSTGEVVGLQSGAIKVSLDKGGIVSVGREQEEILDGDGKVICWIEQYPIQLAWALTVHRGQGATMDRVGVDLSGHFAPGQTYVAMSRCRSKEGLFLTGKLDGLLVDPKALAYCTE